MPGVRTFALVAAVGGGARWEDEARSGWSHLLEHLVFKGAGDMGAREIVERVEGLGGSINAATGYERTSFEVRAPAGALETAMQVLSDLLFRPVLDAAEIEREKEVVGQEIAEAFDTPDDHVFEMAQSRAFREQPLGRPILGSVASLATVDRASIGQWRAQLYAPERMVVACSGAVDEADFLSLAERWFGVEMSVAADTPAAADFVGGEAKLARRIEQANLVFQLPSIGAADPDQPGLRLFTEILGGGMASRLFQSAREARGLAYAIDAYHEAYADAGVLGVFAGAAAERAGELARVAADEFRALADEGPTEAEVARAKAVLKAGLWMSDENPMSRAGRQAASVLIFGSPRPSELLVEETERQTVESVRAVGRRLLQPGRAATAVLGPRAAGGAGAEFHKALFGV